MAEPEAIQLDHEALLARMPEKPGVYRMIDAGGAVLYVGKARKLRQRLASHFRGSGHSPKTQVLLGKTADVEVTVTASDTEALLLEQSLIKSLRPPYNVTLRDDKSYPYIHLSEEGDFPRLSFHRGAKRRSGRYFGPFPSASAVRESINVLQKLFRIRSCEESYFRNRSRPCLQYQIGRCSAPCVGLISPEDYAADLRRAELFLEGRDQQILDDLKGEMERAAEEQTFERAAKFRDQIAQLRKVQERQYVHAASGDVDVFAIAIASGRACVQGLFIRGGRLLGQRNWFPRDELGVGPGELLGAFLSQYYLGGAARDLPKSVVLGKAIADADLLAAALAERGQRRIEVSARVRGQRARWLRMAQDNAELALNSYLAEKDNVFARFVALREGLGLEDTPQRLECFDISHARGEATVASCVVFDQTGPLKSDYRRFNIEGVAAGDDYGAMSQALRRRYERLKAGEGKLPDLLVIDGGTAQLDRARRVLAELQIEGVQVLAIAKGRSRKPGLETLYLAGPGEEQGAARSELVLPPQGPAMHLLQQLRDEAHRFAVTGHRQRRAKARRASGLDAIAGIGPKRKRELLRHFGSLSGVQGASIEEIARLPGISRKLAEEVYAQLHPD